MCSLVAFADIGDRVTRVPGSAGLAVSGPFAEGVPTGPDNLIARAVAALAPGFQGAWMLDKQLPVASGVGGGSADAGAALRLVAGELGLAIDDHRVVAAARAVGADGPMCLASLSAWTEGYGELLTPEPRLPPLPCVLVNPGVPSPTGAVYRAYDEAPVGRADRPAPPADWSVEAVLAWLAERRNDLEAPAVRLEPRIGEAIQAVAQVPGVTLGRMSGSGATVFGLCASAEQARAAAAHLAAAHRDWWVVSGTLGDPATP